MIQSLTNIVNDTGIANYADGTVAALPERSANLKQHREKSRGWKYGGTSFSVQYTFLIKFCIYG